MHDYPTFKKTAIRYWERRRIFYNLALLLPAFFGYSFTDNMNWVGDAHRADYSFILFFFLLSAVGANICYTFAYVLEFLFGSDEPTSRWVRYGRTTSFVAGLLFSMLLALIGGANIANMEWNFGVRHVG